jgi:anti-sigma factor ChrR (cupin superfamily)
MNTGLGLPDAGTTVVRASGWTAGERPGELVRPLVDDSSGFRTMLMQILPGPLGEAHAHDTIEQIYVLDGDFFDEDASYQAGDFVLRMPGTMHRAGSKSGATLLISYAPLAGDRA